MKNDFGRWVISDSYLVNWLSIKGNLYTGYGRDLEINHRILEIFLIL